MADAPAYPSPTKTWHTTAQPSASYKRPELSAKGKSVLVTGGGSTGIGGETARHFAAAGASRIALLGRREKPLQENKAFIEKTYPGVEVVIISADITKKSDVDAAFAKFAGSGKIDTLIHSAATIGPKDAVTNVDGPAFLDAIQTNLAGSLYVSQAFIRHAASDGVAVAINSWGAHLSLNDFFASYCVAKMAVYRLWDTVAIAHPNLSIFHTQPGVILTEMNLSTGGAESFKDIKTDDVSLPASFNLWLASPEARFLKSKFLWCNWDIDELKARAKEIESGQFLSIDLVGWPFKNAA
ncbi:NAD(P)-binding protein [Cryphonectria parasitica EP155]|uniref:NAD(P)-binding protein n=1 Tax=Cryphonectria parasitica (strain ATCC 38755 / EP155) TaxID=660469 RepID=A0A9P4Y4P4_CRYP1|nr:NAD(P)-binding protein [Cryphonectria parasitica EP155]KAF3766648.1 NAD(P)-binding protein [Cryphonectria parasitica EP155]